jgi:WhiB family redox-sensing transcriptional regulator
MRTGWGLLDFLASAIVAPLALVLFLEQAPRLARCLVRCAAWLLPKRHRRRYRSEWLAELHALKEKPVTTLVVAIRITLSAPCTSWAVLELPPIHAVVRQARRLALRLAARLLRRQPPSEGAEAGMVPEVGAIATAGGRDWRHRARCRDLDPEMFFPVGTTGLAAAQIQAAKAVCALCPVRGECLQWALDTAQEAGVWGGLSEEERRDLPGGQDPWA